DVGEDQVVVFAAEFADGLAAGGVDVQLEFLGGEDLPEDLQDVLIIIDQEDVSAAQLVQAGPAEAPGYCAFRRRPAGVAGALLAVADQVAPGLQVLDVHY